MKKYLVGGAVRDRLLGVEIKDRDWVVVGSTPEAMLAAGYQQVGKDFPVFLHPTSKEEYALARTEQKTSLGYHGFSCDYSPQVTLEDDLKRRDLTINAIALTEQDKLIDPYGGQNDIQTKQLRHVSEAFTEDPLRVLRVARFLARLHHLGFIVAEETLTLMRTMSDSGELSALTAERVWQELRNALDEQSPEKFVECLRSVGALKEVFPEINDLFGIPQPAYWHPEIDSGVHTLMTVEVACQLSNETIIRFAALCHDFGKAMTPQEQLPSHRGHEQAGVEVVKQFCLRLKIPNNFRDLAMLACAWHLKIHKLEELTNQQLLDIYIQTDAIRRPERFKQLLIVCEADARGRKDRQKDSYPQRQHLTTILNHLLAIDTKSLINNEMSGEQIAKTVYNERLKVIAKYR